MKYERLPRAAWQRRKGHKYRVTEQHTVTVPRALTIRGTVISGYVRLTGNQLVISAGFTSDGPSGPTFDTANFIPPAIEHDALYKLMRTGHLPKSCRRAVDLMFRDRCRVYGMWWLRSRWVYLGVRAGGWAVL